MNISAITHDVLLTMISHKSHPFFYNLDIRVVPSNHIHAEVTICCHGYGGNNRIADVLHACNVLPHHLVSFNFPDYDLGLRPYDYTKSSFGSIAEIMPLVYVMKQVIDTGVPVIHLYGFSAGGAAVINAVAVLATVTYDAQLAHIGVTLEDKQAILCAIQNGHIILDCPLKSIEEVIQVHGAKPEFIFLAEQYAKNSMRPIDTTTLLEGLSFTIFLYFELPDEIIGNSNDTLFCERLCHANKGKTYIIFGSHGGHNHMHKMLWQRYNQWRT